MSQFFTLGFGYIDWQISKGGSMTEEEDVFQASQSVNVLALKEEAWEAGYEAGLECGRLLGIEEGRRLGVSNLVERLKNTEPFIQEQHGQCLAILNSVCREILG